MHGVLAKEVTGHNSVKELYKKTASFLMFFYAEKCLTTLTFGGVIFKKRSTLHFLQNMF